MYGGRNKCCNSWAVCIYEELTNHKQMAAVKGNVTWNPKPRRPLSIFVSLHYNCSVPLSYEMTSPMRVLYHGLGVATYIPPTVCPCARLRICALTCAYLQAVAMSQSYTDHALADVTPLIISEGKLVYVVHWSVSMSVCQIVFASPQVVNGMRTHYVSVYLPMMGSIYHFMWYLLLDASDFLAGHFRKFLDPIFVTRAQLHELARDPLRSYACVCVGNRRTCRCIFCSCVYTTAQYNTIHHNTTQYNTIQHNTIHQFGLHVI